MPHSGCRFQQYFKYFHNPLNMIINQICFYLQEGTIGHDLVIKPLPATLSPTPPPFRKTIPPEQDDEMFMDPNEDDMVSIDTGLPIKRSKISKKNLETISRAPEKNIAEIIEAAEAMDNQERDSNSTATINKMNLSDDIVYDDEGAKAESKRLKENAASKAEIYEEVASDGSSEVIDLRRELIEALSGAKHVIYKRDLAEDTHHGDYGKST